MPPRERSPRPRSGRRHLHAVPAPDSPAPEPPAPPEGLSGTIASALQDPEPLAFLSLASSLASALDPRTASLRDVPDDDLGDLVDAAGADSGLANLFIESLIDQDSRETTALLAALAALVPDNHLAQRARRECRRRDHQLPGWLSGLEDSEPGAAASTTHPLGDGENTVVSVLLPGGRPISAVVYIDHNLGTIAKDAFVVPEDAASFGRSFLELAAGDEELDVIELDPAEARARIAQAIEAADELDLPLESETWPACRPLVEWMIGLLPAGGTGYAIPDVGEAERSRISRQVLASVHASGLSRSDACILDELLEFAADCAGGDPLRWSPVSVEILMTQWLPLTASADDDHLLRIPTVLRALIRYAHERRGIPAHLTEQTVDAVDFWEPEYIELVLGENPFGGAGVHSGDPSAGLRDLLAEWGFISMAHAERTVGGPEALAALDDQPLPDEPFSWDGIPEDIRPRVESVLQLCDDCAADLFDTEMRTAFRRVLSRTAATEPAVFRRKSKDTTAAAAIAWAVVTANDGLNPYRGGLTAMSLLAHFGVTGSVSDRARPFLRSFGAPDHQSAVDLTFATPEVLTGQRRAALIRIRDEDI